MARQDREYLVGSVWPTNRSGILGDTELDPKLPPAIKLVHVTMDFQEGTEEEFARSIPGYEAKAAGLMEQKPDLIRVLGAPPFMILGFDGESQVIRGWERKYGVPMFTSGQNHVRALRALGVKRFLGATYLPDNLNNIFAQYLREAGFDVIAMEGMDAPFHEVPHIPATDIAEHLKQSSRRHSGAEALYLLGSAWKVLDVIDDIEDSLGVPVVYPLTARSWETQLRLGLRQPIPGYGRLLSEMPDLGPVVGS